MNFNYAQPYIVVGAFIVRDGKVLLIQENHQPDKGKWNLPAGKLDFGENPIDAAKREAFEEAGIMFAPTKLLGIHSVHRTDLPDNVHAMRIVFAGEVAGEVSLDNGESIDGVREIADYKWLLPQEILDMDDALLRYHDIKSLVQNYQADIYYPLGVLTHITQTPVVR